MLYSDEFLRTLSDDPVTGARQACELALGTLNTGASEWSQSDYDALLEAYILIQELDEAGVFPFAMQIPNVEFSSNLSGKCSQSASLLNEILKLCETEADKVRSTRLRERLRAGIGKAFAYEFSQGDLARVQTLVNQLRELIAATEKLDGNHQRRLLKRLEALQSELHKRVSDLDRFWGLVGDAGVVMAKLGTDAKPIVDRIREIADIVWQTQGRAEELPSGATLPQIGHEPRDRADA